MDKEFEPSYRQLEELIGSKVELVITFGLYKGSYASRLEELENGLIGVSHPMMRGAFLPALRSTEMLMKIESNNCFYQATVSVVRGMLNVSVPLLWLKYISVLEKVQRRMFVRVACSIKADAFFLGTDTELPEGASSPPKEWFLTRISDISLGGAGVVIKENLASFCLEGGRYLMFLNIGGTAFFLVGKLVKILKRNEVNIEVGLAYEGLSAFVDKLMGGYIRQQELITRG
jgi:c-di-GMP-binding flagellar brake protein YcgR